MLIKTNWCDNFIFSVLSQWHIDVRKFLINSVIFLNTLQDFFNF